ncbi:MAG: DUF4145 domain-containing protein [Candidatus Obscuribacterales bacterium]|nr:DUF4145 domain-containing protein [Candidatus Obscuribacterales bacterium]
MPHGNWGDAIASNPYAGLTEFRRQLEQKLNELAEKAQITQRLKLFELIDKLADEDVLSSEQRDGLHAMRGVCNAAAHGDNRLSVEQAETVLAATQGTLAELDKKLS